MDHEPAAPETAADPIECTITQLSVIWDRGHHIEAFTNYALDLQFFNL